MPVYAGTRRALFSQRRYDPDAAALFRRFTDSWWSTSDADARKTAINTHIIALKKADIWNNLDLFFLLANHDSQAALLNWKEDRFNLTARNSPTFTQDRGYQGNGTNSDLIASFTSANGVSKFAMNSATLGIYTRVASTVDGIDLYMAPARLSRRAIANPNDYHIRVNDVTSGLFAVGSQTGHFTAVRTASNARAAFKDGVSVYTSSTASTATSTSFALLSSGASYYSDAQISLAFCGAALTSQQIADFYAINHALLQSVGAA